MKSTIDMTPAEIREAALRAIMRELGPVGLARFMQQQSNGSGDYVKDREAWRPEYESDEEMKAAVREWRLKQEAAEE